MGKTEAGDFILVTCRRLVIGASLVVLASCRLVITTDETGHIVSDSGLLNCIETSCEFSVDENVSETFTAVPAEGYRFVRWKGVCQPSPSEVCQTRVAPLPEALQAYDGDVYLSAVFESSSEMRPWYRDSDGDLFGSSTQSVMAYERPEGFVINKTDCSDEEGNIYPRAREVADGSDNNCNGKVDEGFVDINFYLDSDRDGFGDPVFSLLQSYSPEGYVRNDLDCDDSTALAHPEAKEIADNMDNNCDGLIDEGGTTYFRDIDGDGFGTNAETIESLEPVDGFVSHDGDCDDNNDNISPAAQELFDAADNDCDGSIDEGFTTREYYRDIDHDGFGDESDTVVDVETPAGYAVNAPDNCVEIYNPLQADIDEDGIGNACDPFTDVDEDEIQDSADNCPSDYNPSQNDTDQDGLGDACDNEETVDSDSDSIDNDNDNCPEVYNPSQSDSDGDDLGDACDSENNLDLDEDGRNNDNDNCPEAYNPSQSDSDDDGQGDACDTVANSGGGSNSCSMSAEEQSMLNAVNDFRSEPQSCGSYGSFTAAQPLAWGCKVGDAALLHSVDMADNNFFDHQGSNGSNTGNRLTQSGYAWSSWGENIAAGTSLSSVSAAMNAWITSDGHCANLMGSSFTQFGAAKFSNPSSTYNVYWTQVFARPR